MKLHLGCDRLKIPGFKSVDIRPVVHPDIVADVRNLHMIDDDSVDEMYFCHGLEHIPEPQVHHTLMEWHRVLVHGGWLYLSVPDFRVLADLYLNWGWKLAPPVSSAIMGGQDYQYNYHYSVWDMDKLSAALDDAGFFRISQYRAVDYLPEGFIDWSVRKVRGQCLSLNVRALA